MANVNLRVVDVYQGDNVSDFNKAAQDGVWGIIHKASTGGPGGTENMRNGDRKRSRRDFSGALTIGEPVLMSNARSTTLSSAPNRMTRPWSPLITRTTPIR